MNGDRRSERRAIWRTVRFRVTALAVIAVLVTLVVAGTALVVTQERGAIASIDESLEAGADNVADELDKSDGPLALGGFGDDDAVVQIVSADGEVIASTANVEGDKPIAAARADGDERITTAPLPPDDEKGRVLVRALPDGAYLVLGATLDDVAERTASLTLALVVSVPLVVLVLAIVVWWLTGRTLSPVEAVRTQVDAMAGDRSGQRIAEPGTGDEIERLVRTVNRLLDRIDAAGARQRRFVSDASHELRSPLARIRTEVEVDLAHPEGADLTVTHRSVLEEAAILEALVDDLLVLASLDEGVGAPRREEVDVALVAEEDAARRESGPGPTVTCTANGTASVVGDPGQLRRVVRNLVDNAQRHATHQVLVEVRNGDGRVVLRVDDDGPGVAPDDAERIFERFTRLDDARTRAAGGTGLGLAIVAEVVRAHGGDVAVVASPAGGGRFEVTLPSP